MIEIEDDRRVSNMVCVWSEKNAGRGSVLESMSQTIGCEGFQVHDAPFGGEDAEVVQGVSVMVLGGFREAEDFRAENEFIKVKIEDFISPTIIKRLDMEQSIFKARITDWRSQVDYFMINVAYDGKVFNVAVKIIDMLGEGVLVVAEERKEKAAKG